MCVGSAIQDPAQGRSQPRSLLIARRIRSLDLDDGLVGPYADGAFDQETIRSRFLKPEMCGVRGGGRSFTAVEGSLFLILTVAGRIPSRQADRCQKMRRRGGGRQPSG